MIIVFSYNRPIWLLELLKELPENEQVVVIDDGSTYDQRGHEKYCTYYRTVHRGREGFWINWQYALHIAQKSPHKQFLFLQDDLSDFDFYRLYNIADGLKGKYVLNLIRDGIERNWTRLKQKPYSEHIYQDTCVDCKFLTNRETLQSLNFDINKIDYRRFINDHISSGVGQQLSQRFGQLRIPMYTPYHSFCYHKGYKDSEMHKEYRKTNNMKAL